MSLPLITHVAIYHVGRIHALPKPNRHHHVIRQIGGIYGPHTEGFVDNAGNFLNRVDAMALATKNGQLNRREGVEFYQGPELFSEDLW